MDMENDLRYEIAIWLTGQNPWVHQQRESLANAYPFLGPALRKPSNNLVDATIMEAIQRRERPDEILPQLLGVSRAAVSLLKYADVEILGEGWCRNPVELLRALDIVDPTARPRTHYELSLIHI